MIPTKRHRGRPKGTGLNDFVQLKAIAGLMRSDPNLRPTTAIRQLGIQDPSVIRRLRDKFHACEAELMSELRAAARDTMAASRQHDPAPAMPEPAVRAPARAIALATPESMRISQPLASLGRKPTAAATAPAETLLAQEAGQTAEPRRRERPAREVLLPSETKLPEWLGAGLSVYAMGMQAHFAVVGTLFEWPPLAAVLRTQVAFVELAVAAVRPGLACLETVSTIKP